MSMVAISPVAMTDAQLNSTNVPETEHSEWDSGTTYVEDSNGVQPRVQRNHIVYVLTVVSSQGQAPESNPNVWAEVEATNAWKMFDSLTPTVDPTVNADEIVTTFTPSQTITALAFLGLDAASVRVQIASGSTEVYDQTFSTINKGAANWWQYLNPSWTRRSVVTILDLPTIIDPVVTVTISNTGADARCGKLIMGTQRVLGCTMWGVKGRRRSLSSTQRNQYSGKLRIVRRRTVRERDYKVRIKSDQLDYVDGVLGQLYDLPTVIVGSERWPFATLYGIIKDSVPSLDDAGNSSLTLKVEEI